MISTAAFIVLLVVREAVRVSGTDRVQVVVLDRALVPVGAAAALMLTLQLVEFLTGHA